MISRRLIRIKVMQALYAFFQSHSDDLPAAEKQLIRNIDRIYELYIWQLSFFTELVSYFKQRVEEAKQKMLPTEEELHPNTRFLENRILTQLEENTDFLRQCQRFKVNWADEKEMFRIFYNEVRKNKDYLRFMESQKNNYEEDRGILIKLTRDIFITSSLLQSFFEEKNIHWYDDFDTALLMVMKTFKLYSAKFDAHHPMPGLFVNDENEADDKRFAKDLFKKTILYSKEYGEIVAERAKNWELDRIALTDIIILKMAITELMQFPTIPTKVTMNEYIELARLYSTPKSTIFVNGLLDKLTFEYKESGKIQKTGRGLHEK
jgi:N utilization substance protein B